MASPTGTALIPTHGSCLPLVIISVSFLFLSIVFLECKIELVGLTTNLLTISWPEEIPPKKPPARLDKKKTTLKALVSKNRNKKNGRPNHKSKRIYNRICIK